MIPERYASYEKVVTVGAVNFASVAGDKQACLAKIEANIREAAAQVGPEGIQGTHRKLHLGSLPWVSEGVTYQPGNSELIASEFKKLAHGS